MRWPLCAEEDAEIPVPPHGCGPSFSCCSRGALWLWMYLVKPNVEPGLEGSAHQHPYPCPLKPLEPECLPGRARVALPLALQAAARACCAPRDCHPLLSNKTIFSPLCLKPLVIIYLECAPTLALRHVSGNRKPRASMCLPDPCPVFAQL